MQDQSSIGGCPSLERVGIAAVGLAVLCPALTLAACLGFAAAIAGGSLLRQSRAVGEATAPDDVDRASEDSFPASDPPSWTPVAGTGTRH